MADGGQRAREPWELSREADQLELEGDLSAAWLIRQKIIADRKATEDRRLADFKARQDAAAPDDTRPSYDSQDGSGPYVNEPPQPPVYRRASDLDGKPVPERQWLVDGLIPMGKVTLLGGDGGTGKSLLTVQLLVAVATGGSWIGRGVTAGTAVYLSAEDDDDELHWRIDDVARADGLSKADLGRLTYRSMAGEDASCTRHPA